MLQKLKTKIFGRGPVFTKNNILLLVAVLAFLCGVAAAAYVGIWVCFIGGIVAVIDAVKATPVDSLGVALGVARFALASIAGWACFWLGVLIAKFIIRRVW